MKVNFEKVIVPCVVNDITLWHLDHGFLWDVVEAPEGRRIAVFYCTLLCGDGLIIHFETVKECHILPSTILYAFRKGIKMASSYGEVVYATVPERKNTLISILCRLGFQVIPDGGFSRDGRSIALLKYFTN